MRELKQNWRDIFGGFKLAFDLWKIALAFMGIALTALVLVICNKANIPPQIMICVFGGLVALAPLLALFSRMNKSTKPVSNKKVVMYFALFIIAVVLTAVLAFVTALNEPAMRAIRAIAVVAIWALFGGAIARIAAVEIATDDRIGLGEALRFASKKYKEYILAPVLAIVFIAFMGLLIYAGQWACAIPYLGTCFLVIFIFPLVVLAGFIIMLVVVGLVFGFQLMWPTISAEGSDSFDALSRAYAYVYSRPWKYIWYNLVAMGYFMACSLFVVLFLHYSVLGMEKFSQTPGIKDAFPHVRKNLSAALNYGEQAGRQKIDMLNEVVLRHTGEPGRIIRETAESAVGAFSPDLPTEYPELDGDEKAAKVIMSIWLYVYAGLFMAFVFSLVFSLHTTIYFLLRKDLDGTDMTEVFIEEEEEVEAEAAGYDTEGDSAPADEEASEEAEEVEEADEASPDDEETS